MHLPGLRVTADLHLKCRVARVRRRAGRGVNQHFWAISTLFFSGSMIIAYTHWYGMASGGRARDPESTHFD